MSFTKYRVVTMPGNSHFPYQLEEQAEAFGAWKTCFHYGLYGSFKNLDEVDEVLNKILEYENRGSRVVRTLDLRKLNPTIELCGSSPSS